MEEKDPGWRMFHGPDPWSMRNVNGAWTITAMSVTFSMDYGSGTWKLYHLEGLVVCVYFTPRRLLNSGKKFCTTEKYLSATALSLSRTNRNLPSDATS